MDEDLKDAIATGVTAALQKAAVGKGLKDAELLGKVHECESAAQLRVVLGQMKRDGKVTQNTTTGRWALTIAGVAGQAPGKLETPASEPKPPRDETKGSVGEPKRAPCAAAIVAALTEQPQGLRIAEMEQHPLLQGKFNTALISYHTRALVNAGVVVKPANRLNPYTLAGSAPIAPRAAATKKAPRKKTTAPPPAKTAKLAAAAERVASKSDQLQLAPTPYGGLSITMRCPAGELTLTGSRALVFGFLDQLSVQAVLPVWNGSAWVEQETRSPAWAFAEVLRGRSNARPVADSRIDLDALMAWANSADALGLTFDGALIDKGAGGVSNSNFVASDVEHYYRKQLQQKQESHKAALSRIEELVRAMPHPEDCWHRGMLLAEIARAKAAA